MIFIRLANTNTLFLFSSFLFNRGKKNSKNGIKRMNTADRDLGALDNNAAHARNQSSMLQAMMAGGNMKRSTSIHCPMWYIFFLFCWLFHVTDAQTGTICNDQQRQNFQFATDPPNPPNYLKGKDTNTAAVVLNSDQESLLQTIATSPLFAEVLRTTVQIWKWTPGMRTLRTKCMLPATLQAMARSLYRMMTPVFLLPSALGRSIYRGLYGWFPDTFLGGAQSSSCHGTPGVSQFPGLFMHMKQYAPANLFGSLPNWETWVEGMPGGGMELREWNIDSTIYRRWVPPHAKSKGFFHDLFLSLQEFVLNHLMPAATGLPVRRRRPPACAHGEIVIPYLGA